MTDYTTISETATKLKVMKIGKDDKYILMMFEIWSPSEYVKTVYKIVNKDGSLIEDEPSVDLCYPMKLMKADNPIKLSDDKILLVEGENDGSLSTY